MSSKKPESVISYLRCLIDLEREKKKFGYQQTIDEYMESIEFFETQQNMISGKTSGTTLSQLINEMSEKNIQEIILKYNPAFLVKI
jgi:hypothetical protein